MNTQSDMHFAFASYEKFTLQLQVAVFSLLKSRVGLSARQVLHVLDCEHSEDSCKCIRTTIEAFANRLYIPATMEHARSVFPMLIEIIRAKFAKKIGVGL